jgi:prolipoprotein diacylglyceryltransferase
MTNSAPEGFFAHLTDEYSLTMIYEVAQNLIVHILAILIFLKEEEEVAIGWFFGFLMILTREFRFAIHYKVVRMTIPHLIVL